eukprot:CAMPEP_0168555138 /NCGR_PEP_ID=MMETSP0413-20121227/8164_1 /TAXON_ID=136452 /ORGANISM="Filamoeba nolandi, Strain NC-AS-23-1" /LENGTH=73 /DNA_ID=CAMNT_0008585947 /DNA_START=115 /DNA_END=336 /DNA_ORIENTATION=-
MSHNHRTEQTQRDLPQMPVSKEVNIDQPKQNNFMETNAMKTPLSALPPNANMSHPNSHNKLVHCPPKEDPWFC